MGSWQINGRELAGQARLLFAGWQEEYRWNKEQTGPIRAPCWIIYWCPHPGPSIEQIDDAGRIVQQIKFTPEKLVVIAPETPVRRLSPQAMSHGYAHVRWQPDGKQVLPGVYELSMRSDWHAAWRLIRERHNFDTAFWSVLWSAFAALPHSAFIAQRSSPELTALVQHLADLSWPAVSNDWLALQLKVHPATLRRRFQDVYAMAPQAWLSARRIDLAAEMLITSDASIDDIAESCHFCDRAYFSRMFAKLRGCGPVTFRRQQR